MTEAELARFIALETRLIDDGDYESWLGLFADDGHYWLPISPEQTDPVMQPCLAYEDPLLLSIRVKRLRHPQAHSQKPGSRCQHVLQASRLIETTTAGNGDECWITRTPFTYYEHRGEQTIHLAGTATHRLIKIDGTLRIRLKRVDLLQGSTALPMIQLFP
ncbi:MAG: aromatic-ring-hydroxylating dioxygenase subunit beta [Burkholderiaceae bacterium]